MGGGGDGSVARARRARGRGGGGDAVQQLRARQAGVPGAALRVQDLQGGAATGRAVPVAGHLHGAPLPDDVPAQADPARAAQLQAEAARLLHRGGEAPAEAGGLQHDQERARPACQRGEPAQPVPHPLPGHRRIPALGQVHDQQVHGPGGQQRAREGERLLEVHRRQDHQPLRADTARDGLHGIEGTGEVQPRDDRPAGLRLRGGPQRDRRPARGRGPAQRDRGGTRQPARTEDGVQRREPRGDDAAVGVRGRGPGAARDDGREGRGREGVRLGGRVGCTGRCRDRIRHRHRRPREGALGRQHQVSSAPWSGRAPAGLEGGECLGDVGCGSHRTSNNRTSVLLVKRRNAAPPAPDPSCQPAMTARVNSGVPGTWARNRRNRRPLLVSPPNDTGASRRRRGGDPGAAGTRVLHSPAGPPDPSGAAPVGM